MSTNKMREALEYLLPLIEEEWGHWESHSPQSAGYTALLKARAALADDGAARGAMREQFEAWIRKDCGDLTMFGNPPNRHYKNSAVNQAWLGWQASRAAAPQASSPLGRDADWVLAMAGALGTDSGFSVPIVPEPDAFRALFAAVRAAAPQSRTRLPSDHPTVGAAMDLMDAAFAAAPQSMEPVAWIRHDWSGTGQQHLSFDGPPKERSVRDEVVNPIWKPLYLAPPSAPTDAEYVAEGVRLTAAIVDAAQEVERQLGANAGMDETHTLWRHLLSTSAALREHLSTRPAQADALDAARYRWLRDSPWRCDLAQIIQLHQNARWDAAIDAAMSAPPTKTKEPGA